MTSDYGELCHDIRAARKAAREKYGKPCPVCEKERPRACPSILLPEQRCKIDGYRDPRPRTPATEYLHRGNP